MMHPRSLGQPSAELGFEPRPPGSKFNVTPKFILLLRTPELVPGAQEDPQVSFPNPTY